MDGEQPSGDDGGMAPPRSMSHSRTFPIEVERAFTEVLAMPLPLLFSQRHLVIAPIAEVRDTTGSWDAVGAGRTIVLAGRPEATMRETLTSLDPPRSFGYELTDLTGPLGSLATRIEGTWEFGAAGTGVRVTWSWRVHPASSVAARAMPVFARMWRGSAAKAFGMIERELVA